MTDLSKGIIDIEGIILSRNTRASDFINITNPNIKVNISKRGHTYVTFLKPLCKNDIDMYIEVACYKDECIPEIVIYPAIPSELQGRYEDVAKYKLEASKQWLSTMIDAQPHTSNTSCIYYKFDLVDYYSAIREDLHYGLLGGEIQVSFHEV